MVNAGEGNNGTHEDGPDGSVPVEDNEGGGHEDAPHDQGAGGGSRLPRDWHLVVSIFLAVITAIATYSSITQSRYTRKALKETRRSNNLTRQSMKMQQGVERPWLHVRQWSAEHAIEIDPSNLNTPEIEVVLENSGRTPAFEVTFISAMEAMGIPLTTERPPTADPSVTTAGTIHYMLSYRTARYPNVERPRTDTYDSVPHPFPKEIPILVPEGVIKVPCKKIGNFMMEEEKIKSGELNIVCYGWVAYRDGLQTQHATHFCLELQRTSHIDFGPVREFTGPDGIMKLPGWPVHRDRWTFGLCPEHNNTGPRLNDAY